MEARGDTPAFPETAKQALDSYYYAWQPMSRGIYPLGLNFGIIGIFITLCGGNAVVAQKIYLLIWLPIAFFAMHFFLKRIIHINSRFAKFTGSFIYAVSPLVISLFIGGVMGPLREYALLPLLLFFIFRISRQQDMLRSTLLFSIIFTLMFIFDKRIVILSIFFVIVAIVKNLKPRNLKRFLKVTLSFVFAFSLFFVFNLPNNYAELGLTLRYAKPLEQQAVVEGLVGELKWTYGTLDNSPSPFIVMLTGQEVHSPTVYLDYGQPRWLILSLIILEFAFASLMLEKDRQRMKYAIGFSLLAIFISGFMMLTYMGYTIGLFLRFPFLFLYRSPTIPSLMLGLPFSILIAITAENIVNISNLDLRRFIIENVTIKKSDRQKIKEENISYRINKNRILHDFAAVLCILLVISVFSYNWPFFTGNMVIPQQRGSLEFLKQYTIPEHFYHAGEWLDNERNIEFFRTIWLPWTYDEAEIHLRWIDPHTFSLPSGFSKYSTRANLYDYVQITYEDLVKTYKSGYPGPEMLYFGSLIGLANVKYILVNNKTLGIGWGYIEAPGDPKIISEMLENHPDFNLVVKNKEYLIYQNQHFIPHINVYDNIVFVRVMNITELELYRSLINTIPNPNLKENIFILENSLKQSQLAWIPIEPDVIISPLNSDALKNMSDEKRYVFIIPMETRKTVSFRDNFENTTFTLHSWYPQTPYPDVWSIKNGEYICSTKAVWGVSLVNGNFGNVGLETRIVVDKPNVTTYQLSPAIFLRYVDKDNYYRSYLDFRDNFATIVKRSNGTETILYNRPINLELGKSYILKAEATGSYLELYLNGKLITTVVDHEFSTGKVGIGSYESKTHFDDMTVYSTLITSQTVRFPTNISFKIGVKGKGEGDVLFKIDDQTIRSTTTEKLKGDHKFYQTDAIKITEEDKKNVTITSDNVQIMDKYPLVFPVVQENETLSQIFKGKNQGNMIINSRQISPVEYVIEIESNEPTVIYLGEPFDKKWEAYVDGQKYESFPAFWFGNAFYINKSGKFLIKIAYAEQSTRTLMILMSSVAFTLVITVIIYLSKREILKTTRVCVRILFKKRK